MFENANNGGSFSNGDGGRNCLHSVINVFTILCTIE